MKPLAIDLFCGLFGWGHALVDVGFEVVGFDLEDMCGQFKQERPAQLVIQDVLTLHGSQFRDAALIVASPPCQFFSYCAMPWSRAKALAAAVRADPVRLEKELALFKACFRIQREACEAAGRHNIPLIVENVRGAQPWVGRARWNMGSYYLWGDVPALMPQQKFHKVAGFRFDANGSFQTASVRRINVGNGTRFTSRDCGIDGSHGRFAIEMGCRKAASAMIAKIPAPLAAHIASVFYPR